MTIEGNPRVMPLLFIAVSRWLFDIDLSWYESSYSPGSSDTPSEQKCGHEVVSPSSSGRSTNQTSTDDAAARPVAPATSSGLSWRGLKAPKKLVVKRAKM